MDDMDKGDENDEQSDLSWWFFLGAIAMLFVVAFLVKWFKA